MNMNMIRTRLDNIRKKDKSDKVLILIAVSLLICLFGFGMGVFAKFLDYRQAFLPGILGYIDSALDLHNFLGAFAPWLFLALCIAVYSKTPLRAGINVFLFFAGMVSGYYLYCNFVAGFFPESYAMIWVFLTVVSPFFAYICWYMPGNGWLSVILSGAALSFFINSAFAYGMFYISVRSPLYLVPLAAAAFVLRRHNIKEEAAVIVTAMAVAVLFSLFSPIHIY